VRRARKAHPRKPPKRHTSLPDIKNSSASVTGNTPQNSATTSSASVTG
jgi:hypothetical protein